MPEDGERGKSTSSNEVGTNNSDGSNHRISVNDVVGRHGSQNGRPTELEVETHLLQSVEELDLNEDAHLKEEVDGFVSKLYSDIAAEEIAKAAHRANLNPLMNASVTQQERELEPLMIGTDTSAVASTPSFFAAEVKQSSSREAKKSSGHRKTPTVEQRLFGLTAAIHRMSVTGSTSMKNSRIGNSGTTTASSPAVVNLEDDRLTKAANLLVGHAGDEIRKRGDIESQYPGQKQENQEQISSTKEMGDGSKTNKFMKYFQTPTTLSDDYNDYTEELETRRELFREFLSSRKPSAKKYIRNLCLFIMLPSLGLGILLYYGLGNPIRRTDDQNSDENSNNASWSWWILFLGIRQPLMYSLAVATQVVVVDFTILQARIITKWMGPIVTLLFVQARGWPFIIFAWGVYDFIFLLGDRQFPRHWLFWQDAFTVFSKSNPAGDVTNAHRYYLIVVICMIVSSLVALKRVAVSLFLGRQRFGHFGGELADCMKNMVLISEIAALSKSIVKRKEKHQGDRGSDDRDAPVEGENETIQELMAAEYTANETENGPSSELDDAKKQAQKFIANRTTVDRKPHKLRESDESAASPSPFPPHVASGQFSSSQKLRLTQMLDDWEDPRTDRSQHVAAKITLGAVLQFGHTLTLMNARYPFSPAFGVADTREACVESAQSVYEQLLLHTPLQEALPFETIALIAREKDGSFDDERVKELIKEFRPDRDGRLTKLDFVKSIDSSYKSIRLLYANINNSRNTDAAFESIINCAFWFIVGCFVLTQFGIDPMAVWVSLSTLMITFAFVFGKSLATIFEGILFILFQRPYGVGDRVHFSDPNSETSIDGSSGWIVEELTLLTTTLHWGATNERATINNGAICNFRVINAARSPNAQIYVNMKFGIDTPYESIEVFRAAVEQFLKERPREWLAFGGFRPTEVAQDRGFTNYVIIAQHRNSWQHLGGILTSKADLVKFCMEISKQLKMTYTSPSLPVELSMRGSEGAKCDKAREITPANLASLANNYSDASQVADNYSDDNYSEE